MNDAPIGILDSGFGGLSVYNSITALLPHEPTVYIGDHAHIPYSEKTPEHIHSRVQILINFLLTKKVKLVVIACNTATVAGIDIYRDSFPDLPIIGVVPVVKTAAQISKKKSFAVLSTNFTAGSPYQKQLIDTFASDCNVYNLGGHSLVDLVEQGITEGREIKDNLKDIFTPDMVRNIDTVVLGCTHYPFLEKSIRDVVGDTVVIIDSGAAVARQTARILKHNDIQSKIETPTHEFYSTKNNPEASRIASILLHSKITVRYADI